MAAAGLPDPKINFYGADVSDTQAYQDALAASVQALEQRYANPNWFNVAAGFFKPQLGGFAASLGSASQALGETVEKQRESQLPLAQMRAQLAASKITMGQGSAAAKAFADWKATGQPMNEATAAHIIGLAPDSASATAVKAALDAEQKLQSQRTAQQGVLASQYNADLTLLMNLKGSMPATEFNQRLRDLQTEYKMLRPPVVPKGTTENAADPRKGTRVPEVAAPDAAAPVTTGAGATVGAGMPASIVKAEPLAAATPQGQPATWKKGDVMPPAQLALVEQLAMSNDPKVAEEGKAILKAYQAARGDTATGAPATAGKLDTSTFVIKPSFDRSKLLKTPQTTEEIDFNTSFIANAAKAENKYAEDYSNLQKINQSVNFATAKEANSYVLTAIDTDPNSAASVAELLRKKGPLATLLAGGVGVSVGPYGATFSLKGLAPALVAGLDQDKRDYYDRLLNAVSKSVYYDLISRGIDPEKEGAEKFGQRMLQETNLSQGISAIRLAVKQNDIRLDHNAALYAAYNDALPQALSERSMTPLRDIALQHPEVKILNGLLLRNLKKASDNASLKKESKP
jgi:hypothetical protein